MTEPSTAIPVDDLVERLKDLADQLRFSSQCKVCKEAATRIEDQGKEIARLGRAYGQSDGERHEWKRLAGERADHAIALLARALTAERSLAEAEALIATLRADHDEMVGGKVIMSREAFEELQDAKRSLEEMRVERDVAQNVVWRFVKSELEPE